MNSKLYDKMCCGEPIFIENMKCIVESIDFDYDGTYRLTIVELPHEDDGGTSEFKMTQLDKLRRSGKKQAKGGFYKKLSGTKMSGEL